jgi:hypothetical protein
VPRMIFWTTCEIRGPGACAPASAFHDPGALDRRSPRVAAVGGDCGFRCHGGPLLRKAGRTVGGGAYDQAASSGLVNRVPQNAQAIGGILRSKRCVSRLFHLG